MRATQELSDAILSCIVERGSRATLTDIAADLEQPITRQLTAFLQGLTLGGYLNEYDTEVETIYSIPSNRSSKPLLPLPYYVFGFYPHGPLSG